MSLGEVVARLELGAPSQGEFILRGTVPVPPGIYPLANQLVPLSVIDSDGSIAPTQVEHVSSYAAGSRGSDVVEVLARVKLPPGAQPGQRITYDVILDPHLVQPTRVPHAIVSSLGRDRLVLTTRDVFGNLYKADLVFPNGSKRRVRSGAAALQLRTYGVLKPVQPVSGSTGTLAHMMGVHAYITGWRDEQVLSLDLRFHNGPSGLDTTSPDDDCQKKLYFDKLQLLMPAGWNIVHAMQDTQIGGSFTAGAYQVHTLVKPQAGGNLHVLPQQAQFHRRLALTPAGNEARARTIVEESGLAFARPGLNAAGKVLWSWWNPATARYLPQRVRLPSLDHVGAGTIRSQLSNELAYHAGVIASGSNPGQLPFLSGPLGWAHPWGTPYGGMTGGTEITLTSGVEIAYAASNEGYRMQQLQHRAHTDRQPAVLFNRDGDPTRLSQWVIPDTIPWVNMYMFLKLTHNSPDPFGFSTAPDFQVNHVAATGRAPLYESQLDGYAPIDLEHYVRYLNAPRVLAWLGNDALAKDDLLMSAELARLSYHPHAVSSNGTTLGSTMRADLQSVAANPGKGLSFGRYEGWIVHSMAAAYSLGTPQWRAEARPWFDLVVDVVETGQVPCSGLLQATINTKLLNAQYRARQSIEQAIYENALRSVAASVYQDEVPGQLARVNAFLSSSAYGMISPIVWSSSGGPWAVSAVTPLTISDPAYCSTLPSNGNSTHLDKFQTWSTFAYAYEITGDRIFLQRALEMTGGQSLLQGQQSLGLSNIDNRAALQSLAELVNYP